MKSRGINGMKYTLENYELIESQIVRTPVVSNEEINGELNTELYFKCENLQKTGSFKYRGATHSLLKLDESARSKGVVTVSSGNHGAALAKAGKVLGIQINVIIPRDIPSTKLKNIQQYEPEILFAEPGMKGREAELNKFLLENDCVFIPPYNHENIILGQASAAYELTQQVSNLDYLITPVGGGGLASGSILACQEFSPGTKIIGAEPANADDAYRSLQAGKLIPQSNPKTICDGLKSSLGDVTFSVLRDGLEEIILVSEQQILSAMKELHQKLKMLIEPSSATVYAAVLNNKKKFENKKVGLILSGGNLDLDKIYGYVDSAIET